MFTDKAMSSSSTLFRDYQPERAFAFVNERKQVISQREFLSAAAQLASQLPAQKYAINLCGDRYYFALAFVANLLNGTINLLPQNRQPESISALVARYPGSVVLTDYDYSEHASINIRMHCQDQSAADIDECPTIANDQVAAIAFTSGSTGEPKAELKYWRTLSQTAALLCERLLPEGPCILVGTVACQHMFGLECMLFMALQSKAIMHTAKPFFPADIQTIVNRATLPVVLISTPIHIRALHKAELALNAPALIISATAPLATELCHAVEQAFDTRIAEIYGCTEAGSLATRYTSSTQNWQLLPSFKLQQSEARHVIEAPHLPGSVTLEDNLALLDNEHFQLLGRGTDLINIAGKRASISELNNYLLQIAGIEDGVIFSHPTRAERLTAIVVTTLNEADIHRALLKKFDPVMLPRPILFAQSIPRTTTGKATHASLEQLWQQLSGAQQ